MDTRLDDEYLFDDYFNNINLNEELKNFYQIINDDELNETFSKETELTDIRNKNYNRFIDIDLSHLDILSEEFENIVKEIKKLYELITQNELLTNTIKEAKNNKKIIDLIYNYLDQLEYSVVHELNKLENENNERQNKLKEINYKDVDELTLKNFLNKYNSLVLFNSTLEENIYDNYKRQQKRKKYINELYKMINLEIDIYDIKNTEISQLNENIQKSIQKVYEIILYLEDIMIENSKYEKEFIVFKDFFSSLIAYDDTKYRDVFRVHYLLYDDLKIESLLNYFEDSFIKERESKQNEEKFVYEKYGIKNIKSSLNYISANYETFLDNEDKLLLENLYESINNDGYNLEELYSKFKKIVNKIWKDSITDVYSYSENKDFKFICTNNRFIDEKHQTILITNKMLERVTNYEDYQIGYICEYNDNILYITENNDIMTVEYNDMSNLKTPKQLEQEFLNFKVCNRIALNGYITKVSAVYYINDGDFIKYKKAIELSNQYKLPLIVLKKDKID